MLVCGSIVYQIKTQTFAAVQMLKVDHISPFPTVN